MKLLLTTAFILGTLFMSLAAAQVKGTSLPMRIVTKNSPEDSRQKPVKLSKLSPPAVSVIYPPMGKGTKVISQGERLTLKGKALSLNGIRLVTVNGQRARLLDDGSFSADVLLKEGDNALVIKASDTRGNTSTDTFFVTRK